uniref:Uncharacterized protein n=1 Tax=Petromyzon marinus TaxID=7757 RepID=S4RTY9_PETMA
FRMESPWRASRCSAGGAIVRPQPETEQSYMDSVFTFIQDVVPQAYAGSPVTDEKERVVWVRFEKADLNDVSRNPELWEGGGGASTPPLLLMLGYNTGMHIWGLPVSGEAQELYSVRSGPVRCARLLPTPHSGVDRKDLFADKRPLLATCDGASSTGSQPYCGVEVRSLRTGEVVKSIQFKTPIFNLHANHRVLVVALQEKLAAFDSRTLVKTFFITSCYPSPGPNPNPLALGSRWLAYADTKLVQRHQTYGGVSGDAVQSYTATVISAAKTIRSGLSLFGEAVGRLAGGVRGTGMGPGGCEEDGGPPPTPRRHAHLPGIVTIIDTECVRHGQVLYDNFVNAKGWAIFYMCLPLYYILVFCMCLRKTGKPDKCINKFGETLHVINFRKQKWRIKELFAYNMFLTFVFRDVQETKKVQDLSVSDDGRWVCACTLRGTCHVFAVCPYGGVSCVRTHTTPRVANRLSRFHKSAGLDELHQVQQMQLQHGAGGSGAGGAGGAGAGISAGSPAPSPGASPHHGKLTRQEVLSSRSSFSYGNPRLPPFPHPGVTIPLAQVKQPLTLGSLTTGVGGVTKGAPRTSPQPTGGVREVCVSACFAPSHSPFNTAAHTREKGMEAHAVAGSLFVLCSVGSLVEHTLEPHPAVGVTRICDDTPLELSCTPHANWGVARSTHWAELRPPFHTTHPLMLAADAVQDAPTLPSDSYLMPDSHHHPAQSRGSSESLTSEPEDEEDDEWLSQVEIVTHSGPHRRLWMGPQFTFKTLQLPPGQTMLVSSNSSALLSHTAPESAHATHAAHAPHSDTLDVCSLRLQPVRSDPVCMPARASTLEIEAGSGTLWRVSTHLEVCGSWPDAQHRAWVCDPGDEALRERIADAMMESPGGNMHTTRAELQREGSIETLSNSSGSTSGSLPRRYDSSLPT